MFARLPEQRMHWIRWFLTIAWLLVIVSLFYDPWTPVLMEPDHPWSPLRLPDSCILVQGKCLVEQPYPLANTLFWGAIVPAAIFILLVFGHEVWRRICPLSFLSQIPRALGWQRQFKRENPKTGKVRFELEVLAHSDTTNTILADSDVTRILAVPVDTFDDFLELDRDFARRVLELESRQLQRFMRSLQTS